MKVVREAALRGFPALTDILPVLKYAVEDCLERWTAEILLVLL